VQRWLRSKLERRRYLRMASGFRRLQLLARDWLARHNTAAVLIQSVVRVWLVRRHMVRMHHSALVIQVIIVLPSAFVHSPFTVLFKVLFSLN